MSKPFKKSLEVLNPGLLFMVLENIIHSSVKTQVALGLLSKAAATGNPILFVVNFDNQLVGSLSDTDIRKGLTEGKTLEEPVAAFLNTSYFYLKEGQYSGEDFHQLRKKKEGVVPLLDEQMRIVRLLDMQSTRAVLPLDGVLMAGGKGKRLYPLTKDIPKPLLEVGDKPLLEHNVDRLVTYGMSRFFIPVHYLAHKVSDYLGDGSDKSISIKYVLEEKPLGTIGALSLISSFVHDTILVMNADLLTNIDFQAFYQNFIDQDADIAVASRPYNVSIPFGVLEVNDHQEVASIREKPNYTYYTNAGIYLIKRRWLDLIPANQPYDATDLIQLAIAKGLKVASFPIMDYWLDIGNIEDYERACQEIKYLDL